MCDTSAATSITSATLSMGTSVHVVVQPGNTFSQAFSPITEI
jgi:hypothetical protein